MLGRAVHNENFFGFGYSIGFATEIAAPLLLMDNHEGWLAGSDFS